MKIINAIINWFKRLFAGMTRTKSINVVSHADWLNITAAQDRQERKGAKRIDDMAGGGWDASCRVWAKWGEQC